MSLYDALMSQWYREWPWGRPRLRDLWRLPLMPGWRLDPWAER